MTWNPLDAVQTMTAFIAATGQGDVPTGSLEYKTIFAVGAALFVMTFVMNLFAIRLVRASVRCTNERCCREHSPRQAARAVVRAHLPRLPGDLAGDRLSRRGAARRSPRGVQVGRRRPLLRAAFGRSADLGRSSGDPRDDLSGDHHHRPLRAAGRRDGDLPRGVREPRPVVQPDARGQHQNLAAVPFDRLRDPRPCVPRPGIGLGRVCSSAG